MIEARKGDCTDTYTGKRIWAMDPRPNEICIEDIAHALSLICRYNGHCRFFYSVAQHSLHCSDLARNAGLSQRTQMLVLMHDAAEAYISDIVRPVKAFLPEYNEIECNLHVAILKALGVAIPTYSEQKIIDIVDLTMLATEVQILMPFKKWDELPYPADDTIEIIEQRPADVERVFLGLFKELLLGLTEKQVGAHSVNDAKER